MRKALVTLGVFFRALAVRVALVTLGVISGSLAVLMGFAATQFPRARLEVLPWIFLSYLWGTMTVLSYMLYVTRPKKQRRPLDDYARQVVRVELPTEYTTRH